jgi:hypothetical protein
VRAASLGAVYVVAKLLAMSGQSLPVSVFSPIVYFWQDALVALLYAALDRSIRRIPGAGWTAYGLLVLYSAVNVPISRVLSTPLTCPMFAAARGTLGDSIVHYLSAGNLLLIVSVLAAGAVFPVLLKRLSSRWACGLAVGAGLLRSRAPGARGRSKPAVCTEMRSRRSSRPSFRGSRRSGARPNGGGVPWSPLPRRISPDSGGPPGVEMS